jgi:hypothetical protein
MHLCLEDTAERAPLFAASEITLGDDEWVELKTVRGGDGTLSRLLSRTLESVGPWSVTLDVKHGDVTSLLRTVHVLHSASRSERDSSTLIAADAASPSNGSDANAAAVATLNGGMHADAVDAQQTIASLSSRSYALRALTGQVALCETRAALGALVSGEHAQPVIIPIPIPSHLV